ncbi:MAG: response regulator [Bacteroidota bacterium]
MKNILIIDDEEMIREGLKAALEIEGYNVTTADNGMEISVITESFQPHLIITDIIMPEMDGIEVIIQIRKKLPDTRIIAISGGGRISADNHLKIAEKLGADAVLTKPFSTNELKNTINSLKNN